MREVIPPTVESDDERWGVTENHPAWGKIGASRVSNGGGAVLFDSDIKHQHTIMVRISTATRNRHLDRDWLHGKRELIEVEMSEAQWAQFVSSMNSGDGTACTIRAREGKMTPGMPYEPRLQESMKEVEGAAQKAFEQVREAFAAYEEKKNVANLRNLRAAIENAPANIKFSAKSLTEHAENVVQKAKADVEAMVLNKAEQLGLNPADLADVKELGPVDPPPGVERWA
jgi:hypothetical protein